MKKIFSLVTIIAITGLQAGAQIKKGATLVGGGFSYNNSVVSYTPVQQEKKYRSGDFNISAGSAIKENKVLGFYAGYGHAKYDDVTNYFTSIRNDNYRFGVFYRQYKKLAKDLYGFGEIGGGYTGSNRTDVTGSGNVTTKYNQSGGAINISPGMAYRVYKKLQVELIIPQIAGLQYSVLKTRSAANNSKEDQFSFYTNLNTSFLSNLGLGFRFVL